MNSYIINGLRFVLLLLLQVLIVNNIRIGLYINPYVYILFILLLPFSTPRWVLLVLAFALGLSVDWFMSTTGLHASATVLMAFLRPWVIRLVSGTQVQDFDESNNILSKDKTWFFTYSVMLVIFHQTALYFLEAFSFHQFGHTLLRIFLSVVVTEALILMMVYFFTVNRKR
jgi:hypothetical protein